MKEAEHQRITRFFRVAAFGRWPPRVGKSASVKGGGHPFAALAVGSRGVGKRKTLSEIPFAWCEKMTLTRSCIGFALAMTACIESPAADRINTGEQRNRPVNAESVFLPPYREDVALLSAKYGIDTALVATVLKSYLVTADPVYRLASGVRDTLSGLDALYPHTAVVAAKLDTLAAATGIPKQVLGSLLFDMRLARLARESAER